MTQICLLDSSRLSGLLKEALPWSENVSSLMVSARNGSVLAYAYKSSTPSIKNMRTTSTTVTAAYTAASEETLVCESQDTGAVSVITPIADHILLAVTGFDSAGGITIQGPEPSRSLQTDLHNGPEDDDGEGDEEDLEAGAEVSKKAEGRGRMRKELESVSEELAEILRDELSGMEWPEDI